MRLSFSSAALRQVEEIYAYIAANNPRAAQKIVDRIYTVSKLLAEFPNSGRETKMRGVRVRMVHPYPYLIFYRQLPGQDDLRILRVRHAKRQVLES